jgi:hypothetical protein
MPWAWLIPFAWAFRSPPDSGMRIMRADTAYHRPESAGREAAIVWGSGLKDRYSCRSRTRAYWSRNCAAGIVRSVPVSRSSPGRYGPAVVICPQPNPSQFLLFSLITAGPNVLICCCSECTSLAVSVSLKVTDSTHSWRKFRSSGQFKRAKSD